MAHVALSWPGEDVRSNSCLPGFDAPGLFAWLEQAAPGDLDRLPFGVIALARDGTVEHYNKTESARAGLSAQRVVGRAFFAAVAPCMDNATVAGRFLCEPTLDDTINYVLTFRMRPQNIRLRMLSQPLGKRMYLAVRNRN
jgi:photoactive yellow protein